MRALLLNHRGRRRRLRDLATGGAALRAEFLGAGLVRPSGRRRPRGRQRGSSVGSPCRSDLLFHRAQFDDVLLMLVVVSVRVTAVPSRDEEQIAGARRIGSGLQRGTPGLAIGPGGSPSIT